MLCMTQYICAPLQSAEGFILEGDWTPTKTKLLQLTTYRGGSLISFQDKILQNTTLNVKNRTGKPDRTGQGTDTCPKNRTRVCPLSGSAAIPQA